jgi:hypothetical protein
LYLLDNWVSNLFFSLQNGGVITPKRTPRSVIYLPGWLEKPKYTVISRNTPRIYRNTLQNCSNELAFAMPALSMDRKWWNNSYIVEIKVKDIIKDLRWYFISERCSSLYPRWRTLDLESYRKRFFDSDNQWGIHLKLESNS